MHSARNVQHHCGALWNSNSHSRARFTSEKKNWVIRKSFLVGFGGLGELEGFFYIVPEGV